VRIVVVHDAARPFAAAETIDAVIAIARKGQGGVAALPVIDTLKEVGADGEIRRTLDRRTLWRAQTPQAFPRPMLEQAYLAAQARGDSEPATDDAALVEQAGFSVTVVRGTEIAMKITEESDFARAEALLAANT
jgi:2-C-methyl-D-erythritol 4-phosphate cytidylyltransferase